MWYATFGLSISILTAALSWFWVYVQEQLPKGSSDWVIRWPDTVPNSNTSLEKKDCFDFVADRYICQYVEVRRTSPGQAAKWLALQGLFAILRVAIWIWNPDLDDFIIGKIPLNVFGDPADDDRFLTQFIWAEPDGAEKPRKQELLIGWQRALKASGDDMQGKVRIREEIVGHTKAMWDDLDAILLRARKMQP
ncbi:MAG: hypothetical protein Q9170_004887 [Blastenia crenularia]